MGPRVLGWALSYVACPCLALEGSPSLLRGRTGMLRAEGSSYGARERPYSPMSPPGNILEGLCSVLLPVMLGAWEAGCDVAHVW